MGSTPDASRFTSGLRFVVDALTTPLPVDTLVFYSVDKQIYRSTNATVATYVATGLALADVLDGTFRIDNTAAPTKKMAFSAAGITAGQTRTLTMSDFNISLQTQGMYPNNTIADPGTGAAIPVTASGQLDITVGAGAETNTCADSAVKGQVLAITCAGGAGTREITFASAISGANTIATMNAGDYLLLVSLGTRWQVVLNVGAVLS